MLFVRNQTDSLEFWVEKLNFMVLKDIVLESKVRWIEICPSDSRDISLILFPLSMITNRKPRPLPVIIFKTLDIKSTIERMKGKGVIFSHGILSSELGISAMFKDNEGNDFIMMEQSRYSNKS